MSTPEELAAIRAKAPAERTPEETAALQAADHPGADPKKPENMIPKSRFDEVNEKLKASEAALKEAERKAQEAETARLTAANDYKALYEKEAAEKASLAPKAAQVEAYEKTLEGLLEAQLKEIPEERRRLVPSALSVKDKLDYIAQNAALLKAPKAFDIGAGRQGGTGGGNQKPVDLTPEEQEFARKGGLTDEEYAKYK